MYKVSSYTITRLSDGFAFPHDSRDPNYSEYLAWLQAGGAPEIENIQPVPATITASQARVALHRAGLLASVTALVDAPQTDQEIKIFWEYEVELNRDSPALNAMAAALGLTSQQLDDLFRAGANIAV